MALLRGLLVYDPSKRLTVQQALAHEYFTEFPPASDPALMPTFPEIRNDLQERKRYPFIPHHDTCRRQQEYEQHMRGKKPH
jgi:serine/threonine protein kinase